MIDSKKEFKKAKNQAKQAIIKETTGRISPYIRPHTLTHTVASAIRYVHIIFYLRTLVSGEKISDKVLFIKYQ